MSLFVFLLVDGEDGTVLAANRSIDGAWWSALGEGLADPLLPGGEPLTKEGLEVALDKSAEVPIVGTDATGATIMLLVRCYALGL